MSNSTSGSAQRQELESALNRARAEHSLTQCITDRSGRNLHSRDAYVQSATNLRNTEAALLNYDRAAVNPGGHGVPHSEQHAALTNQLRIAERDYAVAYNTVHSTTWRPGALSGHNNFTFRGAYQNANNALVNAQRDLLNYEIEQLRTLNNERYSSGQQTQAPTTYTPTTQRQLENRVQELQQVYDNTQTMNDLSGNNRNSRDAYVSAATNLRNAQLELYGHRLGEANPNNIELPNPSRTENTLYQNMREAQLAYDAARNTVHDTSFWGLSGHNQKDAREAYYQASNRLAEAQSAFYNYRIESVSTFVAANDDRIVYTGGSAYMGNPSDPGYNGGSGVAGISPTHTGDRVEWLELYRQAAALEQRKYELLSALDEIYTITDEGFMPILQGTALGREIQGWMNRIQSDKLHAGQYTEAAVTFIRERLEESRVAFEVTQDEITSNIESNIANITWAD
ncbi:MAG: hypothetical protein FWC79_03265 [Oscillospiraceae bacterium]|nr:hypothetical protein [Oscillospiraceae bacterium]